MNAPKKKTRNWKPENDEKLKELLTKGMTDLQCAYHMGFGYDTVKERRIRLGWKKNDARNVNPGGKHPVRPKPPEEKPNPLILAEEIIPGFRKETMCIHSPGNRIEKLTIDEVMRRLGL